MTLLDRLAAALDERLSQYAIGRGTLARDLAVLALETIREPTIEQYDALSGTDKMWREMNSDFVWKTYIDAALGVE